MVTEREPGVPKTDEERAREHEERYGSEPLPERGEGMRERSRYQKRGPTYVKAGDLDVDRFTGAGAIGVTITRGQRYRLLRVELHLSAAPTTSENFTITRDDRRGSLYDTVYYKRDLSVGSVTDLVIPFGEEYEFEKDDEIDIAYTNTDAGTWGLLAVLELLEE